MAEKKSFFRRIFSFGDASEEERTPEHGTTPRANDTEVGRDDAPDPDLRPAAAANVSADVEAGSAGNSGDDAVTPVSEMGNDVGPSSEETDPAQKKTP